MKEQGERILVIRLSALGDLVLCFPAFESLRRTFPQARIALLTSPAFDSFARRLPWFDEVLTDSRAPLWNLAAWGKLARKVRAFAPTRVVDMQGKYRQTLLFWLLGGVIRGPLWSGAARGCSHPRPWPPAPDAHFADFIAAQLKAADIPPLPFATEESLAKLAAPLTRWNLPERYALLIPGCAASRPYKRWPAAAYAELARKLEAEHGLPSLLIGTAQEAETLAALMAEAPAVTRNLGGQTDLFEVAALARGAALVIGNDTGPTHLAAAVGAPTLALLSEHVNPRWSAPRGPRAAWLQGTPLAALPPATVAREAERVMVERQVPGHSTA